MITKCPYRTFPLILLSPPSHANRFRREYRGKKGAIANLPPSVYVLKTMVLHNPPSGAGNSMTIGFTIVVVRRKGDTHALDNIRDLVGDVAAGL